MRSTWVQQPSEENDDGEFGHYKAHDAWYKCCDRIPTHLRCLADRQELIVLAIAVINCDSSKYR